MVSDPGDYIGQGLTYSFTTPDNFFIATQDGGNAATVGVRLTPDSVHTWTVQLAAPLGQQLAIGTYDGAVRTVSRTPGTPGMDVHGEFRGCNALTGSFTVHDLAFGPFRYVERFRATFEQHCEGAAPALHGEVNVENPPPLPLVEVRVTVDPEGQLHKQGARLSGTLSCTRDAEVDLSLVFSQNTMKGVINGSTALSFDSCPPNPMSWQAQVVPWDPRKPFARGTTTGDIVTTYIDPFYEERNLDGGTVTTTVMLREG